MRRSLKEELERFRSEALHLLRTDRRLLALMLVSAATEAAMYAFVIEWTPALTLDGRVHGGEGLVFTTFMLCYMGGATLCARHSCTAGPPTSDLPGATTS